MKSKLIIFLATVSLFVCITFQGNGQKVMAASQNDYPIVLVHGLAGWDRNEALGFKYWGGLYDIQEILKQKGYPTMTAAVGPFASNWDRTAELYAYIMGGTVDYGAAHAAKEKHARFGKTYPGIYKQWSDTNKLHLVGHSMGGLTIRQLTDMLEDGDAAEQNYYKEHPEQGISPLFVGGKHQVQSVTTIATPNNGTSFAENENALVPVIKDMVTGMSALSSNILNPVVYDFKLDQFGLKRQPNETLNAYNNRVYSSSIWKTDDISSYDLSVEGVIANQANLQTKTDVYYFSYTGQATTQTLITKQQTPIITMFPAFVPAAKFMNSFRKTASNGMKIDDTWAPNDGLVNVVSSYYPFGTAAKAADGNPVKGQWSYYPVKQGWDHIDFIGIGDKLPSAVNGIYIEIAKNLVGLPK
ncbi:lipase [Listeria booriae]|uniref:triacylglycerol lipase n=1 Tax=Listeria booriae TaxID=1552123 RepID=A0A841YS31_9LIST|nr:lipase [Listeria booriae]MBC1403030.1 lipase [Listeria booriae]MBC1615545.1 lipase [Listeria booriae]